MADEQVEAGAAPQPLNEYQRRHLYFGLVQVDKLLNDIEHIQAAAASRPLFPRYHDDITLPQRKLLEGSVARLRAQLAALLRSQGMKPDPPRIEASGAIRTNLVFAEIAVEELGPSNMRGYGELDDEQAREIEGVVAELRNRFEALLKELSPEPAGQLENLIVQLPASPHRELLILMEKITRERGMMEFRAGLALALERLAAPAMEVAVFGRVSCGKSSLLNYLLGADVLPTGATPITAVPTRIGYGSTPSVVVQMERTEKTFTIEQLAGLASERENPDNRLGITRLTVRYPSQKLRQGVLFVDTPGLCSIRGWGAMETLAYLPRSDMAILLVDAGSTLGSDELELVRWLHQGGIPVQVLLSKADLVSPTELEQGVAFTVAALQREAPGRVGGLKPVRAVSVRRSELAAAWFEADILPLYATLRQRRQASIGRRLGALRDGILAALRGAAQAPVAALPGAIEDFERQLRLAEAAGDRVKDRFRGLAPSLADAAEVVIQHMAEAVESAWSAHPRLAPAELRVVAGEALGNAVVARGREAMDVLAELGQTYATTLQAARQLLPRLYDGEAEDHFALRDLPMPEVGAVAWEVTPPRFAGLGRKHVLGQFRGQFEAHRNEIAAASRSYGVLLQQRGLAAQLDMQRQFQARADIARAALLRSTGALEPEEPLGDDLRRQVERLEAWNPEDELETRPTGGAA